MTEIRNVITLHIPGNKNSLRLAGMVLSMKRKFKTVKSQSCCCIVFLLALPHIKRNTTNIFGLWAVVLLISIACSLDVVNTVNPKFDPSTQMKLILVPADAQVGSIIYRLRAFDEEFDYPLTFELMGDTASATIKVESLPCTKYNSVCQANVLLQRRLEIGRYYDFEISVKDTEGDMVIHLCSITATNFTTPYDHIFPHKPSIIIIPEDAKRGTELDYVIARRNPIFQKPVYLELWGSHLFAIRQKIVTEDTTEGTIFLLGSLDFEKQAMYHLTVIANDAYAEPGQDSRNIAGLNIVVIVQDVQDQPPVFTLASPVTKLPVGVLTGDKILNVHAVDGDKGNPREVRYGLISDNNPFTSFFHINDTSGEIYLMRPIEDIAAITNIGDPMLLTVVAEEVRVEPDEPPAMTSTVQLAFLLPERINSAPYFENDHYVSRVDENAPQGTALSFLDPYVPRVYDDNIGKNGVFSLTLVNNNGTFEISPNVVERSSSFLVKVRDNVLLDYEERYFVQLQILAQEIGPSTNLSTTVNLTIYLNDVNDNPPIFEKSVYMIELPENMTLGTKIVQVNAHDVDSVSSSGLVRYTALLGYLNTSLNLDAESGVITVATENHGFDRETMPEYHLYVEARDDNGNGNRAQVPLVIQLSDVNDEVPMFQKNFYEFILAPDLKSFTSTAIIYAIDKDSTNPNNEVRYEIVSGNYDSKFHLEKITGQLSVRAEVTLRNRWQSKYNQYGDFLLLTARAYDLGVPILSSTTCIRIYPPDSRIRTVTFMVPGGNPDKLQTEEILSTITGGRVIIHDIGLFQPGDLGTENITGINSSGLENSIVTATVLYESSSVVDLSHIQHRLSQLNSSYAVIAGRNTPALNTLYKAENKVLFWLLILLATLVALLTLILLLCCICSWCPLYGTARQKVINVSSTNDGVHLVHRAVTNTNAKSVQVSEWMGRREAWSVEKPADLPTKPTRWEFYKGCKEYEKNLGNHSTFNNEENTQSAKLRSSLKGAKIHSSETNLFNDRDICVQDITNEHKFLIADEKHFPYCKSNLHINNHPNHKANGIKHLENVEVRLSDSGTVDFNTTCKALQKDQEVFIRDGNIEILKLMTSDKYHDWALAVEDGNNCHVNVIKTSADLSNSQLLMVDNSGKEILMRRFIEEQLDGKQIIHEHYHIIPGAANIELMPNEIKQEPNLTEETISSGISDSISLKLQNKLMHQIVMGNVKSNREYFQHDVLLETQSLPGLSAATGTQTESEVGNHTDPNIKTLQNTSKRVKGKVKKRKARSENDDSLSENEYQYDPLNISSKSEGVYLIKRKYNRTCGKYWNIIPSRKHNIMVEEMESKIRTPIEEENFDALICNIRSPPQKPVQRHDGIQKENSEKKNVSEAFNTGHEVLINISDSLCNKLVSPNYYRTRTDEREQYPGNNDFLVNDGINEIISSEKSATKEFRLNLPGYEASQCSTQSKVIDDHLSKRFYTNKQKSSSLRALNKMENDKEGKVRVSQSETNLHCQRDHLNKDKFLKRKGAKYMEPYFGRKNAANYKISTNLSKALLPTKTGKNKTNQMRTKKSDCIKLKIDHSNKRKISMTNGILKEDLQINSQNKHKFEPKMSHPLLQHSEYRFERENVPRSHSVYRETRPLSVLKKRSGNKTEGKLNSSSLDEQNKERYNLSAGIESPNATEIYHQNLKLKVPSLEEDHDSGIVMSSSLTNIVRRNPIADKKSIFSIAYDDVNGVKKMLSVEESPECS